MPGSKVLDQDSIYRLARRSDQYSTDSFRAGRSPCKGYGKTMVRGLARRGMILEGNTDREHGCALQVTARILQRYLRGGWT